MKKLVAILTLSVVLLEPVSAFANWIKGAGWSSCGTWTAARRANGFDAQIQVSWVLGYLSGLNDSLDKNHDFLAGQDAQGITAWIDNFCAAQPLKQIFDAADALREELAKNRR